MNSTLETYEIQQNAENCTLCYSRTRKENKMFKIFKVILTENFQCLGKLLIYTCRKLNTVKKEKIDMTHMKPSFNEIIITKN
jgi:hypothetical protein